MSENILISPLGLSPGAVSGMAFALKKENYNLQKVVTVSTSHPDVLTSASYLDEVLYDASIAYENQAISAIELKEENGSAGTFSSRIGNCIETANKEGWIVHVGVTAGRSGMGALATLAANLYGTDFLWHLWVDNAIELGGQISQLARPFTADNIYLNPTKTDGAWDLVSLPFIDLRPLHPLIWRYYKTGEYPNPESPFYSLFATGNIKRFEDVFPAGLTMGQVDRMAEMTQLYPELEEEEQFDKLDELSNILQDAGIIDKQTKRRLRQMVQTGGSSEAIVELVAHNTKQPGLRERFIENKEAILVAATIGNLGKALLEIAKLTWELKDIF